MKYGAYLFDFDYTLADTETGILIGYREVLEKHGYTGIPDGAIRRTIGRPIPESFTMLCGETDAGALEAYRAEYAELADIHMTANTAFYPGALSLVRALRSRGKRTGIVSTKSACRIKEALAKYDIAGLFDAVVGGDMVRAHKPDPEGIFLAVRTLNADPARTLYIGDTVIDAETALRAGVDFAGVTTGVTAAAELAAFPNVRIVADLGELERDI